MARILNRIEIGRHIEEVFAFVTTPAYWHLWHPSTRAVTGDTDYPLRSGARVTEEFSALGFRDRARWTVIECNPPSRWVIEGQREGGGRARITYELTSSSRGTLLQGEFSYCMPNLLLNMLDGLLVRRCIASESEEAIRRLRVLLETGDYSRHMEIAGTRSLRRSQRRDVCRILD